MCEICEEFGDELANYCRDKNRPLLFKPAQTDLRNIVSSQFKAYTKKRESERNFYDIEDANKLTFGDGVLAVEELISRVRYTYINREGAYRYDAVNLLYDIVMVITNTIEREVVGLPLETAKLLLSCVPNEEWPTDDETSAR